MHDFVMEDMAHRRFMEAELMDEFGRFGFLPVETPVVEYAATFAQGIHQDDEERMYRMFDATGRTLALRPEMTAAVARLAATTLCDDPLPLRLCYWAKTYRAEGGRAHDRAEVTQAGVELLGVRGVEADAEVIAVMVSSLRRLGLREFRLAVGHSGYVQSMLRTLPDVLRAELRRALIEKDLVAYGRALVGGRGLVDEADLAKLSALPHVRGGAEAVAAAREAAMHDGARAACDELDALWEALCEHGVHEFVRLDMGLYLHHEYYTGVVIEGYADLLGYPICFGGRYDRLLEQFGRPAPATGCVLHIERLMAVVEPRFGRPNGVRLCYAEPARSAACGFARFLRERGHAVAVDAWNGAPETAGAAADGAVVTLGADGRAAADEKWLRLYEQYLQKEGDSPC